MNELNKSAGRTVKLSKSRHQRVEIEQDGQRVDNFLIRYCPGVPRSHLYQLIRKGAVLVNGKRVRQTRKLVAGEQVRIPALEIKSVDNVNVPSRLAKVVGNSVLFEHKDFLVVNKPAGVAVHGGSGLAFGLIDALRQHRDEKQLELAHRLDRATSGCLLIGRGLRNTRRLQEIFRQRTVEKHYLALVDGYWPDQLIRINVPLMKNVKHAGERRVVVSSDGQSALTFFKVAKRFNNATLLDVRLETGRTHQIRVHTRYAGHAVVGDNRYGDNRRNRSFKSAGLDRLYLHSQMLRFAWDNEKISIEAPVDRQWQESLAGLRS